MSAVTHWIDRQDAHRMGRQIALVRVALGVALVAAPSGATRRLLRAAAPSPEAVTGLRMAGGRDVAMGLGALLAGRRRPEAMRGWLEVGSLVEAVDAYAYCTDRGFRPLVRFPVAAVAAGAAALEMVLARRIA